MKNPTRTILLMGVLGGAALPFHPVQAATYQCQDSSGVRILTDNPVQLQNCTLFHTDPSRSAQPSSPTPASGYEDSPPAPSDQIAQDHRQSSNVHQSVEPAEEITIPLTKMGGSLIVQAQLNQERSAQLILDTGASMTVLSTDVAIDLGILGTTDNELMTVNTAGGQVQVNVNYLASVTVGSAKADHVAVAIHDLPDIPTHIEGLLGMSFLKHFLVTLDAEHGYLILRPKQQS